MSIATEPGVVPPASRTGLIMLPAEAAGQFVVKDPDRGTYFQIGAQEHFLLTQLDGRRGEADICGAFSAQFGEPLTSEDLQAFLKLAARQHFLVENRRGDRERDQLETDETADDETEDDTSPASSPSKRRYKQKLLHYRLPFLNPDGILNWLEPRLRWIWTTGFVLLSALGILAAVLIVFTQQQQWLGGLPSVISWRTILLLWFTVFVVSMLHEFAHGLTCKHFGGEVREIGFLLLFFMPCFYCNVSDAWLFREKWKRLWVGFAGAYCDLCLWAVATFVWRLTLPETAVNQVAWMFCTVCGGGCFLNFNPFVKMDGYYILSDWTGIPNLSDRGRQRWFKTVQWLLWGARRPAAEPRSRFLLLYGMASWLFILSLFCGLVVGMLQLSSRTGYWGVGLSLLMTCVIGKNLFKGVFAGEFLKMFAKRKGLVLVWTAVLIGVPALFTFISFQERAAGTFQVRPSTRVEINALTAGFLRDIAVAEGKRVSQGSLIARVDIPDLDSNLTRKGAEIRESQANLRRLEAGPRPEEVTERRQRVEQATAWNELGKQDLKRAKLAFAEEMNRIDRQISQRQAELALARQLLEQAEKLHQQKALPGQQLLSYKTEHEVKVQELEESLAQKRVRDALGNSVAEADAARREKELANEVSQLKLMESGGRPEEIEAERARLARLTEERTYLEQMNGRVQLTSPVAGIVTTPRMHEKQGLFVPQGTVVCVVEELSDVMAEISIPEDQAHEVQAGQRVELHVRAMPFRTFQAEVERKAPTAVVAAGQSQGTVVVYCRLAELDAEILSGMTGHARIYRESSPLGTVLLKKAFKHLRTEFWW